MLKTLVGDAAYYKSVERYFDQHDGQAATIEDWLAAFEDTTGRDLSQFKLWYQQAGTPQVKVSETYENGSFELTFEQSTPPHRVNLKTKLCHSACRWFVGSIGHGNSTNANF